MVDIDKIERAAEAATPTVQLGPKLFEFTSFDNWCDTAKNKFKRAGILSGSSLCIDTRGRICGWGEHFMTAQAEDAFPVSVYLLRDDMAEALEALK